MPGIVGLITKKPGNWAAAQLGRMVDALRHDYSYDTGVVADESMGVYLGWAERAGSFAGGMPIHNEDRSVELVFSGEEFPEPGVCQRLKSRGHIFGDNKPE